MVATLVGGGGLPGRRCPRDFKRLTADMTERSHVCDSCGYRESFGTDRAPLVTAGSARSLVAAVRVLRAAGKPLPTRRVPGIGREAAR